MKKKLNKVTEYVFYCRRGSFFDLFRVFTLFILFSTIIVSSVTASSILQDIKLSVQHKNVSISRVLDDISLKTGYSVLIRDNDINTNLKVSVNMKDKTLGQILADVFKGMDVKYDIVGKTISVYKPEIKQTGTLQQPNTRRITGIIKDDEGEPVIGANVVEKGSDSNGSISDIDGRFELSVPNNAVLVISFIGFNTQEIPVGNKSQFNITLTSDVKTLDEVVVVGYTSQKKASLTGAISNVKVDENLRNISSSNMTDLLAGTMSGLNITSTTGLPGTSSKMMVRTQSSFAKDSDGNLIPTSPIFVIDGIVREKADFDRLDANEVDNVTILKDAASAAIYGARASGGVVLVSTRKGKVGKPMLSYSGSFAVEQRGKGVDLSSGVESALIANYIHRDDPENFAYWDEDEIDHLRGINNGWGYNHVDDNWRAPVSTHHSVNVSGGTERLRYFANGSYFKQNGFLNKVDYSRYNFRGNLEMDVTKDLTAFVQFGAVYGTKNKIGFEGDKEDLADLYGKLQFWQWEQKTYTSDGKPVDYGWLGNIGEFTRGNSGYNKDEFQSTELQFKLQYKVPFVEGLKVSAMYNNKYGNDYGKAFSQKQHLYQVKKLGRHQHIWTDEIIGETYSNWPDKPELSQSNIRNVDYQLNLQADYARKFGDHDISALFVYEQTEGSRRYFEGGRETFPILIKDQWFATSSDRKDSWVKGDESESGRLSYVTQVNYGYNDKYLFSASLRVDGSMNYAPSKRYGYFPAASGAWIISQEKFFNTSKIDFLKLRASVGLTGSDSQIGWRWQERYAYNNGDSGQKRAYFGNPAGTFQGIRFDGIVNPNATWEKSLSYNIGADIRFLDHWSASADFWYKNTYDILADRVLSLPTSFGFSMPKENYGEVHSKGLDLEVTYTNKVNKVNYFVKGVFSYGTNEVIIQDYAENAMAKDIPVGKKIGYIQGLRDEGIVRTQGQLDEINTYYKELYGPDHEFTVYGHKLGLGMLNYQDLSGPDGKPDGKIDDYDKDVLSMHSVPPVTAGLTLGVEWNGFSLQTLFQGSFGHKRFADGKFRDLLEWNRMPTAWIDHWTPENPNASMPQPVSYNDGLRSTYSQESTFWLYKSDYVKMKYLNFGYNLPQSWVNKLGAGYVKLYFSATNLFTISGFKLWDPEVGGSTSYPNMRTFNFGLDFSF